MILTYSPTLVMFLSLLEGLLPELYVPNWRTSNLPGFVVALILLGGYGYNPVYNINRCINILSANDNKNEIIVIVLIIITILRMISIIIKMVAIIAIKK